MAFLKKIFPFSFYVTLWFTIASLQKEKTGKLLTDHLLTMTHSSEINHNEYFYSICLCITLVKTVLNYLELQRRKLNLFTSECQWSSKWH